MNKSNLIKRKILELEGGRFQRLCDDWLYKKGYKNLNPIGMMTVTDRVTTGTPDSLILEDDGSYIFAEHTAQQDGLFSKVEKDIEKCFDETKTGISIKDISKIICCHTGQLNTNEISSLRSDCAKQGVILELHYIDSIVLSIVHDFPVLAEDHLSIPLDSGQILSPDEFIKRYNRSDYTTPIDNPVLFRDKELENCIEALEENSCVVISGPPGTGKTHFAVNLAKRIDSKKPDVKTLCVFDKGADLERDITAYLSEPGQYLILIDDANRLDQRIDYILHYLNQDTKERHFKIIATVRDYARDQILRKVNQYTDAYLKALEQLEDDQISAIAREIFGIKNDDFLNRIVSIAKGNPRIASMAAKIAIDENSLSSIQNVASIYDKYFGNNESVDEVVSNEALLATSAIICFYRSVDYSNGDQMTQILGAFGLSKEEFWQNVGILHKNELVDLYENEVVKISDQILSTYLFYQCVFVKRQFSFSLLVEHFFPSLRRRLVDAVNPILSAFNQEEIFESIKKDVLQVYESKFKDQPQNEILVFLHSFWFAMPTEALIYARDLIGSLSHEDTDWLTCDYEAKEDRSTEQSLIGLLSNFRFTGGDELSTSLDLLLTLATKSENYLKSVLHCLCFDFSFKRHDYRYGYENQTIVIDKLMDRIESGESYPFSRISMEVCKAFLKLEHNETEQKSNNSFNYITFRLPLTERLLNLRKNIFKIISILLQHGSYEAEILDVLRDYSSHFRKSDQALFEKESSDFGVLIVDKLSKDRLSSCLTTLDICERLDELDFKYPEHWCSDSTNERTKVTRLILLPENRRLIRELGYEEHQALFKEQLRNYFAEDAELKFRALLPVGLELAAFLSGRNKDYALVQGIEASMKVIAEHQPDIFLDCLKQYFPFDHLLNLSPDQLLFLACGITPEAEVSDLVSSSNLERKDKWMTAYFVQIPTEEITSSITARLVTHIEAVGKDYMPSRVGFLDKYHSYDPLIFEKIVNIIITKSREDIEYGATLFDLFNSHSEISKKLFEVFPKNSTTIFDSYLCAYSASRSIDYGGSILTDLVDRDPTFLLRFIDKVHEIEEWPSVHTTMPDLDFLWDRSDYLEIIDSLMEHIANSRDEHFPRLSHTLLEKLFPTGDGLSRKASAPRPEVVNFLRFAVKKHCDNKAMIHGLFDIISTMHPDARLNLISLFIDLNNDFEVFRHIDILPSSGGWTGSRVPTLVADLNFLERIVPLLTGVEYLEHKNLVNQRIDCIKNEIRREKKKDFTEEL